MAQPAVPVSDDRTDLLGVPVFWHKPTADPPSGWDSWVEHFNLAITLGDRCDPRDLLKPPGKVHDDPVPKSKVVGTNVDAAVTAYRIVRDEAAIRRVEHLNEERLKAPELHRVYFSMRSNNASNLVFFSLGPEGRKRFFQSYLPADLSAISFKKFYDNCVLFFKKGKNYIIERLQICNAVHADRESLEAFYLRLTGQAALCGWTIDQEKEVLRDIFIVKVRYKDINRQLCILPGTTTEDTLKSAFLQDKGAQTASSLQK